jgi:hypothetical protein
MNWTIIKRKDRELREREQAASLELGRLRYENTIGVNPNSKQPRFKRYAEECEITENTVRRSARAYEEWQNSAGTVGFDQCLWRQYVSQQDVEAIEAVAEARGISGTTARQHHRDEVQQVKRAMEQEILKGSTPTEAKDFGHRVAKQAKSSKDQQKAYIKEQKEKYGKDCADMDSAFGAAERDLLDAVHIMRNAEAIDQVMIDLANQGIGRCRAILALAETFVSGSIEVDWDKEMAKLTGG